MGNGSGGSSNNGVSEIGDGELLISLWRQETAVYTV